jgi:hypothetical protein
VLSRTRPWLRWFHVVSLVWESLLNSCLGRCPLTLLENRLETRTGAPPYQSGFLLHYLDKLVYPDISAGLLTIVGVGICVLNLTFHSREIVTGRFR